MKRVIWIAGAAGLMWTVPALDAAAPQDRTTDPAQAHTHKDEKQSDHSKGTHAQHATTMSHRMANHADQANHAQGDGAQHDAMEMAHDRAMSHAAGDGNAAHADVANRAATHMAPGSGSEMQSESHDAAGQMRTAHEHGEMRDMEGGGATEGGNGEGGGRISGSQGGM